VYDDNDFTPNPDLKGWSANHPFPPEIEVESPLLDGSNCCSGKSRDFSVTPRQD
jgi:hypothetical protein